MVRACTTYEHVGTLGIGPVRCVAPRIGTVESFSFRLPHGARCLPSRRRPRMQSAHHRAPRLTVPGGAGNLLGSGLASPASGMITEINSCVICSSWLLHLHGINLPVRPICVQSARAGRKNHLIVLPTQPTSDPLWSSCGDVFHL